MWVDHAQNLRGDADFLRRGMEFKRTASRMEDAASEIEWLRVRLNLFERYCNRDIKAQIEAALETKKTTGKFPFED